MDRLYKRGITLLLLGLLAVTVAGCRKKRLQASPMPAPTVVSHTGEDVPPPQIDAKPQTTTPPELVIPPTNPPRPPRRSSTQPPAPEPEPEVTESKPAAPRMAPRLSPAQADDLKEKTWQAINTTEKNLQSVSGRTLTAAQRDLEGKVQGFLAQAREAIGVSDWVRAFNLADKALVLSQELVKSL